MKFYFALLIPLVSFVNTGGLIFANELPSGVVICMKPAPLRLDPAMREVFCEILGLNGSSSLLPQDLQHLPEKLDLSGKGLQVLNGIEKATQVKALNLSYNDIQDLRPLLGLPNLEAVTLAYNQIDYLSTPAMVAAVLALQDQGVWVDHGLGTQTPLEDFNDQALSLSPYLDFVDPTPGLEAYQWYQKLPGRLEAQDLDAHERRPASDSNGKTWISERLPWMGFLIHDFQNPPLKSNVEDSYRLHQNLLQQSFLYTEGSWSPAGMPLRLSLDAFLERIEKDLNQANPDTSVAESAVYEQAVKLLMSVY